MVEADTSPGFYSRSGRVGEVERNERESGCWSRAQFFKTKVDLLPVAPPHSSVSSPEPHSVMRLLSKTGLFLVFHLMVPF